MDQFKGLKTKRLQAAEMHAKGKWIFGILRLNWSNILYKAVWLTFIIGVSFHNIKPLKDANQFIIVANHNSHFDTVSIMAALPSNKRKNTCAVASGDYFGKSPFTVTLMKIRANWIVHKRFNFRIIVVNIIYELIFRISFDILHSYQC